MQIWMIDATYIALIGEKSEKTHHLYTILHVSVFQHGQTKVQEPHYLC